MMPVKILPPNTMWFVFVDHGDSKFEIKGPMQADQVSQWRDAVSDLKAKGRNVDAYTSRETSRDDIALFWNGSGYAELASLRR